MTILDQYGLEIAIPSPNERERTSYVSRGKIRFVDEIHIPKAELRSSAELLFEFQNSGEGESCLAQSKTKETGAAHRTSPTSNKVTCAETLSSTPSQASLFTQRTNPKTKRNWKVIPANSSYGGALSIAVSKMVTKMERQYDQDGRQSDAALRWDAIGTVLLKAFAKHGVRDFSDQQRLRHIHEGSSKTRFEYCEDSQHSLAYFRAIHGHSGGIPVDPELMIYHRSCSFRIQSILENGLKDGRLSSHL